MLRMRVRHIRRIGYCFIAILGVLLALMEFKWRRLDLWPISTFSLYTMPLISSGGAVVYIHKAEQLVFASGKPIHELPDLFPMGKNIVFVSLVQNAGRTLYQGGNGHRYIQAIESQLQERASDLEYSIEHIKFDPVEYYLTDKIKSRSTLLAKKIVSRPVARK